MTAIEFTTPVWVALLAAVLLASVLAKLRARRGTTEPATRGAPRLAS